MPKLQFELNLPNQLTLLRIALTPVFVAFLLSASLTLRQLSLVVFIVAALTDWYDGWIARRMGYSTRWGKFLDPLADKVLSSAALLSYAGLGLVDAWMVWIVISRDFFITGLRSYAELRDQPIITSRGAQAKTFGEFVVIYYILIFYVIRSIPVVYKEWGFTIDSLLHPQVLFGMMLLVTLSTVGTGIAYLFDNRKIIRELLEELRWRRTA
jgi:CDP-diacylglycerol--glycerol-3-phosphate 3-phosphatidyltransferase